MKLSSLNTDRIEAAVFIGTLVMALVLDWRTSDLIWSLWLSSLAIGCIVVIWKGLRRIFRHDATKLERMFSVIGATGSFVLFLVHFGPAHYLYAAILDLLMPLMDHPGRVYVGKLTWSGGTPFSFWETLRIAGANYWPVVILNIARDRSTILSTAATTGKEPEPYLVILKLHFLVMGLMACYALGLESFPIYAAVYVLLYSPARLWKVIHWRSKTKLSEADQP